jgi:hypothetical protein
LSDSVCTEIEKLLINVRPYNQSTVFNKIEIMTEYYQTTDFYISKTYNGGSTDYTIIPVMILKIIQKDHPEYLSKWF